MFNVAAIWLPVDRVQPTFAVKSNWFNALVAKVMYVAPFRLAGFAVQVQVKVVAPSAGVPSSALVK